MAQAVIDGDRNQTESAFDDLREEPIQVPEGNGHLNDDLVKMAEEVIDCERNQTEFAFDDLREEPIQVPEGNEHLNDAQAVKDGERNQTELAFDDLREEPIQVTEGNGHLNDVMCDVCIIKTLHTVGANIALYLCYICDKYLCQYCFKGHESHLLIKKNENERMKKLFLDEVSNKRKREEKFERETIRREFLGEMRNEYDREEYFEREEVSMIDKVNVKHELDQEDCYITGLCGFNNTMWVVSDFKNECIKIFSVGSNILKRCIRFQSKTCDVTEITVKREPTAQAVMSTSDNAVPRQAEPDKQYLLAITLPWKYRILIIDITPNPAVITKSIETEKHCYSIDFSAENICTLCIDDGYGDGYRPWFISVMSTDGVTIKNIKTDLRTGWPDLAVFPGRFYLTNPENHTVLCGNENGQVVSHKRIEGSRPEGISVDPATNKVYVCAELHDQLYRLDSSLESFQSPSDFKSINLERPYAVCFYRDKLYVGHERSTHENCVNVVRVL